MEMRSNLGIWIFVQTMLTPGFAFFFSSQPVQS
jgi:hypothetical protein